MTAQVLMAAVDEAVSRGAVRVPPYPSTALQLQSVLAKDDYATSELVEAMRTDQVFTGNLLRLANSPMYRRAAEVTSIASAVMRVGARELTRLAMAAAVSHAVVGGALQRLRRRVWRESLAAAVVAEALAADTSIDTGEAFVAGLLHDVGKLVALSTLEDVLARHPALSPDEATCWNEIERVHVGLGGLLAQRWQLPGVLGAVISAHHDGHERGSPLTALVLKADAIVALLETQNEVKAEMLEQLGLDPSTARSVALLLPRVPDFLNALDVEPVEAKGSSPGAAIPSAPDQLCLELAGGTRGAPWPVRAFEAKTVSATVPEPLQPGLLFELLCAPVGLRFWAVVERCEPSGDLYEAVFKPFALSGENARKWEAQLSTHRAAA